MSGKVMTLGVAGAEVQLIASDENFAADLANADRPRPARAHSRQRWPSEPLASLHWPSRESLRSRRLRASRSSCVPRLGPCSARHPQSRSAIRRYLRLPPAGGIRRVPQVQGATASPAMALDLCSSHQSGGKGVCPAQSDYLAASGGRPANATDQRGRLRARCRSLGAPAIL